MKKVVVIVGSLRNGNSLNIANAIKNKVPQSEIIVLGSGIEYCTGGLLWYDTHKCVIHDRMDSILPIIINSDYIFMITPVRYSLISGDMKVFIDRLNPTAVSEDLVGKKVAAIAIGQTTVEDGTVQEALSSFEMFANNANIKYLGGYPVYECYGEKDMIGKDGETEKIVEWVLNILEK